LITFLLVVTIVNITIAHAVFAIISTSDWIVVRLNFTIALLLLSWPWITSKSCN
jgi:hypothetical protein